MTISYKVIIWIAIILSIIAIIIATIRCEPITLDWMGVLVGILSLLVTILLGWQIYNALRIEHQIKNFENKIEDKIQEIEKNIQHLPKDYSHVLRGVMMYQSLSIGTSNSAYIIMIAMDAIHEMLNCSDISVRSFAIDEILEAVYILYEKNKETLGQKGLEKFQIYKGKKAKYIYDLNKIDNMYVGYIKDAIEKAPEVSEEEFPKDEIIEFNFDENG